MSLRKRYRKRYRKLGHQLVPKSQIEKYKAYRLYHKYAGNTAGKEDNGSIVVVKGLNKRTSVLGTYLNEVILERADRKKFILRRHSVKYLFLPFGYTEGNYNQGWGLFYLAKEEEDTVDKSLLNPVVNYVPLNELGINCKYNLVTLNPRSSELQTRGEVLIRNVKGKEYYTDTIQIINLDPEVPNYRKFYNEIPYKYYGTEVYLRHQLT